MMPDGGVIGGSLEVLDDDELEQAILDRISQRSTSTRPTNNDYPLLDEFEQLQTIGTGSFSRVRLVRNKKDGKFFALKILKKAQLLKLKQVEHVINEKKVLEEIRHPFIANLVRTYQDSQRVFMLLEYIPGGELFFHLKKAGRFGVATVRFYVACMTIILEHLHNHNCIYRDLKPENIIVDQRGYLRLTDFGFAKKVQDRTWTLCGTPEYLAPEVIQSRGHGKAVDWWGLGIMMFEMLSGYPPFHHENPFVIYQRILEGRVEYPKHFDPWAKDLIKKLLAADQSKRIGNLFNGANDIMEHRFFKGFNWKNLKSGKMKPPFCPKVKEEGDTSNFECYNESLDDPDGEPVDPVMATHAFQDF
ncbi:hypothetical protein BSKO_06461 [Bryopsis sp. KO-2023]|nr:hypothetical protein BSKO_06461 [Bryopsis sp. KO-2023]